VRRVPVLICALAVVSACAAPAGAYASGRSAAEVQRLEDEGVREIIVARDPGLSAGRRGDLRSDAGVTHVADLTLPDTEVVRAPAGGLVEAVDALEAEPGVRYAEPNGIVRAASNDPFFSQLWGLQNLGAPASAGTFDADIDAPEAWARSTGAGQQVAVVDSGTTLDQQDLQGGAMAPGRDFVDGDNTPTDATGHGTHVTGTIVARKDNGIGVAGVAPAAQVVPLRVLDATDSGTDANVASAFNLAGDRGIPIVNASLQEPGFSQAVEDAIAAHPNTLYVVAAGNGTPAGAAGGDNDAKPVYPCALPEANVICVGASDESDAPAPFSNFGLASVDLFAPGVNIISTFIDSLCAPTPPPCFAADDGTSMAAPHVSGALALMRAVNPALTASELKATLLQSVDPKPALADKAATGGRLNAAQAVAAVPAPPAPVPVPVPAPPAATGPASTAPVSTGPAAPAAAAAATPPVPAVVPSAAVAPVLGRPSITAGALTARHALTLRFKLDRAATVKVTIARGTRTVATVSIRGRKGQNRYVLRTKVGRKRLARGRYRLRLRAIGAARAYAVAVTVR
jgi:thermitase